MKQLENKIVFVKYKAEYKNKKKKPQYLKRLGVLDLKINGCKIGKHKIYKYIYIRYFDFLKKDIRTASRKFKLIDPKTNKILFKVG